MDRIDGLTPELRALVHEHGSTVIFAFLDCKVTNQRRIAFLIATVKEGSTRYGNARTPRSPDDAHAWPADRSNEEE